jgi:hypothetical protein
MFPLQRTTDDEVIPPWRTYLGVRPTTFVLPLQDQHEQKDAVMISRAWDRWCDAIAGLREKGFVPLLVQVIPQQGAAILDSWRASTRECIEAVTSMSESNMAWELMVSAIALLFYAFCFAIYICLMICS